MKTRPVISHLAIMGDSLSDRGTLAERKLLGCIPMSVLGGLSGVSPNDRFTNGLAWSDHFIAALASEFSIKRLMRDKKMDASDIVDGIITRDRNVQSVLQNYYDLKNSTAVTYRGLAFARTYAEGGLSAHDYSWVPTLSLTRFFSRMILSNLGEKRALLLQDDRNNHLSKQVKAETLVIEWSGPNDFITVNDWPDAGIIERALRDRMQNVRQLMQAGYKNFILFNLPDISLTPRFQARPREERQNMQHWVYYFNQELLRECEQLQKQHPEINLQMYDVNQPFTDMYLHSEKYGLEKAKLKQAYIQSADFNMLDNQRSPAKGYMFWDDIHPTADVHAILTYLFCETLRKKFDFIAPMKAERPVNAQLNQCKTNLTASDWLRQRHGLFRSHETAASTVELKTKRVVR